MLKWSFHWLGVFLLPSLAFAQGAAEPVTGPAAAATTPAADVDLEEIRRALEADVQAAEKDAPTFTPPTAQASGRRMFNPEISVIGDFAFAWFTTDEPRQTGGHDPAETGFNLQGLELSIRQSVDPYFRFDGNLVFSLFGVELEEAYATTLSLPYNLQARFGQFLTRFGRYNPTHPHQWSFLDQMLVYGKFFGPENNRGLGVEGSVLLPLPWYAEVLASMTDAEGAESTRSFYGSADVTVDSPADFQYTLAVKQFFPLSDDWSLNWGVSAALGPNPTGRGNRSDIYGTDIYLKWRPITTAADWMYVALQAEYLYRLRQVPQRLLRDHGGYAYLIWHFSKRWETGVRHEWVSGVEDDPLDPEWNEARHRTSGQLSFFPTEFSRLRAQINYDRPRWEDPYWGFFLGAEISVGAHGAHAF